MLGEDLGDVDIDMEDLDNLDDLPDLSLGAGPQEDLPSPPLK